MSWRGRFQFWLSLPWSRRQAKLNSQRLNFTEFDFCQEFSNDGAGNKAKVARVAWKILREEAAVADFRPKPEDDLLRVFGLADEDLDDLILAILEQAGARVPGPAETLAMGPIENVEDLIQFVATFLPQQSGAGSFSGRSGAKTG